MSAIESMQFQTLILTLTVFIGGGVLLALGHNLPDGTSQAVFALWGAAATNAFNARQSDQTAKNVTTAAAASAAQAAAATAASVVAAANNNKPGGTP